MHPDRALKYGNLDFSTKLGATKYFIVGTVALEDPVLGHELLALRHDLAWQGVGLESCFHATQDKQIVLGEVFKLLGKHKLTTQDFGGQIE